MRTHILFPLLIGVLSSCNESSTAPPGIAPPQVSEHQVVSLAVGNQTVFYEWFSNGIYYADDWGLYLVHGDTIINDQKWFVTDKGIQRSDSTRVYLWDNDSASVYLDYKVSAGQPILFQGLHLVVNSVGLEEVFQDTQIVVRASLGQIASDTASYLNYATKFGVIAWGMRIGQHSEGDSLVAALVEGREYGDTTFLHD